MRAGPYSEGRLPALAVTGSEVVNAAWLWSSVTAAVVVLVGLRRRGRTKVWIGGGPHQVGNLSVRV